MTILRGLILTVLALPLLEIAAFIAAAAIFGFLWALAALALLSFMGAAVLRHGGGAHVTRVRTAIGENRLSALHADSDGALVLIAGILLLVPGFVTGILGLLLLIGPLRRWIGAAMARAEAANDNVIDLAPEDWRQVPDPQLPDRDNHSGPR